MLFIFWKPWYKSLNLVIWIRGSRNFVFSQDSNWILIWHCLLPASTLFCRKAGHCHFSKTWDIIIDWEDCSAGYKTGSHLIWIYEKNSRHMCHSFMLWFPYLLECHPWWHDSRKLQHRVDVQGQGKDGEPEKHWFWRRTKSSLHLHEGKFWGLPKEYLEPSILCKDWTITDTEKRKSFCKLKIIWLFVSLKKSSWKDIYPLSHFLDTVQLSIIQILVEVPVDDDFKAPVQPRAHFSRYRRCCSSLFLEELLS